MAQLTEREMVAAYHEQLLQQALAWRKEHPDFTFSVRQGDISGQNRLGAGFWFTGNDGYLFFAPFRAGDSHNKTKTIGLVFSFRGGKLHRGYSEVVFGGVKDEAVREVNRKLATALGGDPDKDVKHKFEIENPSIEGSFRWFMENVYPKAKRLIEDAGLQKEFYVSPEEFESNLGRIEALRAQRRSDVRPDRPKAVTGAVTNRVYFGPPGTGKTYVWESELRSQYRVPAPAREEAKELQVQQATWLDVIIAALKSHGGRASVPDILQHPAVQEKSRLAGRTRNVAQTIWGQLQVHAPANSETVKYSRRTGPELFDKLPDSSWKLLPQWASNDPERAEAVERLLKPDPTNAPSDRTRFVTFHPSYSYEEFVEGIRPAPADDSDNEGAIEFRVKDGVFKRLCAEAHRHPERRYALFIDEINRANLAKVLGELITLIEGDKRVNAGAEPGTGPGIWATLPASGEMFGVPNNLDIYGTMNTADRSIAQMDIALRRRFEFVEVSPKPEAILGSDDKGFIQDGDVRIDLRHLLRTVNSRIEHLLDRDHCIGHSYLMGIRDLPGLRTAFRQRLIPLLQEYFFEDWSRIQLVLAALGRNGKSAFVEELTTDAMQLFGTQRVVAPSSARYRIATDEGDKSPWTAEDFVRLYSQGPESEQAED